jgi:hypothetical protein
MAQLALDDVERHALVGELDGVGVAQLVGCEAARTAAFRGDAPQLRAGGVARPGPAAGPTVDHAQQRADRHRQPELEPEAEVIPAPAVHADLAAAASFRVADQYRPRRASRSGSVTVSASVMRSPARQSSTISARRRAPWTPSPAWRMTATISSSVGGSGG